MILVVFFLNLPYTLIGVLLAMALHPYKVRWEPKLAALIFEVRDHHFLDFGHLKNWRGLTLGHTVMLNSRKEEHDLAHELVHVEQHHRLPLLHPIVYLLEHLQKGYKENRYEKEAYERSGSRYRGA